ncbi:M56 family metallopeptidase [Janthinobacterium sp. Mn2066]|uniref:M56 family metallopeptidase n=1 Tax=Janthinobacterium sp. Mn2066 TaxID=3395264 RepID=UPI003BDABA92
MPAWLPSHCRWLWLSIMAAWVLLSLPLLTALPAPWKLVCAMLTMGMLLTLLVRSVQLMLHRRRWQKTMLPGTPVYLSPLLGPCVAGLLRPCIVMPAWLSIIPAQEQALLLAHAQCRLAARDPQLLAAAYALLVVMPWNLPLWWLLHRLRFAIEVDGDARMLAQGHDLKDYTAMLRRHGQYYSGFTGAAPFAQDDPRALRRRRRIMARPPQSRIAAANLL